KKSQRNGVCPKLVSVVVVVPRLREKRQVRKRVAHRISRITWILIHRYDRWPDQRVADNSGGIALRGQFVLAGVGEQGIGSDVKTIGQGPIDVRPDTKALI